MKKIGPPGLLISAMVAQLVLAGRERPSPTINHLAIILFYSLLYGVWLLPMWQPSTPILEKFYSARNQRTGWQNGIAMAEYSMSAASFFKYSCFNLYLRL